MKPYKYTKEILEPIVKQSFTISDVVRGLGLRLSGSSHSQVKQLIRKFEIGCSHFLGYRVKCGQKSANNKRHWSEILIHRKDGQRQRAIVLRRALLESGREHCCEKCGNTGLWKGRPLVLEMDHKDDNWLNDTPENLSFMCSNCHSQKPVKRTFISFPKQLKICTHCKTEFAPRTSRVKFCSYKCSNTFNRNLPR